MEIQLRIKNSVLWDLLKSNPEIRETLLGSNPVDHVDDGDTVRQFHGRKDNEKHLHLMKIYALAPLLLGKTHQPEIWLKYAHDSKLLPSTHPEEQFLRIVTVDDAYLHVAEVVKEAITLVQTQLIDRKAELQDLHNLFESIDPSVFPILECIDHQPRPLEDVLHKAKEFTFLHEWKNLISSKQNIMKPDPEYVLNDRQLVVCLLFVTRQYLAYALNMENPKTDIYGEFEEQCKQWDKDIAPKKERGNSCFKAKNYKGAIEAYTDAIRVSRYNAILYGNRAQSFSHSKMYREALCDSIRSIALDPCWHKGYYRCAQALFDLRRIETALKITEIGIRHCPYDKNLKDQMIKFTRHISEHPLPPHKRLKKLKGMFHEEEDDHEDDGPPDLVTSSENDSDSDLTSSDSESTKPSPVYPKYQKFVKRCQDGKKTQQEEPKIKSEKLKQEQERLGQKIRKEEEEKKKKIDDERREKDKKHKAEDKKKEEELRKKKEKQAEMQREEEKKKKILREKQDKDNRHTELMTYLSDGSKALLDERINNALLYYAKAMDVIDKYTLSYFDRFKDVEYVILKYSLGDTCVKTGTTKEIQQGMSWFNEILQKHKTVKFPLAFLGLGRAYHRQNRFIDAIEPLRKGITVMNKLGTCSRHTWPGTEKVIEETRPGMLVRALQELINRCRHPPAPEATCRYHHCTAQYKILIYIDDPDLKGFVRVRCLAKCKIEYHLDCWRKFKKERISSSDKDYLNVVCFTPNCEERISEIIFYDHNGTVAKNLKSPENIKAINIKKAVRVKMKLSSELKIAKKTERIARKKEYKETKARLKAESQAKQIREGDGLDIISAIEQGADTEDGMRRRDDRAAPGPQLSPVMVLRKDVDEYAEPRGKSKKSKRRDKACKVTMSLDEFVGREEEVYEDEYGVLHRTAAAAGLESYSSKAKYPVTDSAKPFQAPSNIHSAVTAFESSLRSETLSSLSSEKELGEMTNSILQFFAGILREHGPVLQDDVVIQRELEEFPQKARDLINNAGGLGKFLIQSLEFAMIDNVVCVMTDAVKARELAQAYKTPFKDRYVGSKPSQTKSTLPSQYAPSLTSQILDSSLGGFPNKLNVIKSDSSNEVQQQDDLFADLNFKAKTSQLDQLDFIEDLQSDSETKNNSKQSSSFAFSPSVSAPSIAPTTSIGVDKFALSSKLLDDIDDDVSDIANSEIISDNRSTASFTGSGTFYVKDLFKKQSVGIGATNSQESSSDKGEKLDSDGRPRIKSNPVSDIARLDDLDTFSRGSSDAIDDIHDSTNVVRNQSHIQDLKLFTSSLNIGTPDPFSASRVLPDADYISLQSSPTSSVYSLDKSKISDRSYSITDKSHVDESGEPAPLLKSSRLKDWLPKSSDVMTNVEQNEENVDDDGLSDRDQLKGGILSNPAAWRHKKLDLDCLENFGGLVASDDDDDECADMHTADVYPSPIRADPDSSPFVGGSRSGTPDIRSCNSLSPAGMSLPGLPRPSTSTEDSTVYPRVTNVFGAIGSRDSPLQSSVSSRGSSKTGTPLHTPNQNREPLPLFPSAHDTDDFPCVIAPDIASISKPGTFNVPMPKLDNSNTLFPTSGFGGDLTTSLFPVKPSIWGSASASDIDESQALDAGDVEAEVKKHHEKIDNDFVKEYSRDTYNSLKDTDTFKDNPHLLQQIERDIRNDVERGVQSRGNDVSNVKSRFSRKMRNAAVQYDADIGCVSTACNTDPYEPNKDKLNQACALLDQTNLRYTELLDKHVSLKNSSTVEIKELRSRLDATEQECKGLRSETTKAVDERDSELRKWTQDKRNLSDELKNLKQQYRVVKSVESNVSAQLRERQSQMERVNQELSTERVTIVQEREHHQEETNVLRKHAGTQLARAQNSEVKFLKLQMSVGNQILDSTLKDSEMRCMQITQTLQGMIEANQPIPPSLQTAEELWRKNGTIIREMRDKHIKDHQEQIEAVQNGTPLDVLPELGLPKPPPPPQVSMPGRMNPIVSGIMPPMTPFINTGPPPFHLQNGNHSPKLPRANGTPPKPVGATGQTYSPGLVRPQPTGKQHKAKSSFEKIINQLNKVFPHCQKSDFMKHIQELRTQRGGSLSGMTMAQIVQQVAERMLQAQQAAQQKPAARISNQWMAVASAGAGEEIFEEEEDPCLICFDELLAGNTTRLECGHRYHTECIRKWFYEQSTCPMCRNHALLPDEYPSLG